MSAPRYLLAVVEQGGYPDFTALYQSLGYQVSTMYSMRKALKFLSQTTVELIVVEFKYGPMYGTRLSNLEPLCAAIEAYCANAQVIILFDTEDRQHLQNLCKQLPQSVRIAAMLSFPIQADTLKHAVQKALCSD